MMPTVLANLGSTQRKEFIHSLWFSPLCTIWHMRRQPWTSSLILLASALGAVLSISLLLFRSLLMVCPKVFFSHFLFFFPCITHCIAVLIREHDSATSLSVCCFGIRRSVVGLEIHVPSAWISCHRESSCLVCLTPAAGWKCFPSSSFCGIMTFLLDGVAVFTSNPPPVSPGLGSSHGRITTQGNPTVFAQICNTRVY